MKFLYRDESLLCIVGDAGENLACPGAPGDKGYLNGLYGICSSGENPDCDGYYDMAKCCQSRDVIVMPDNYCSWRYGKYGEDLECPQGYMLAGFCGSGKDGKCGAGGTYTGVKCCSYIDNRQ